MSGHTVKVPKNEIGYKKRKYELTVGADTYIKPCTRDLLNEHNLTNFVLINGITFIL